MANRRRFTIPEAMMTRKFWLALIVAANTSALADEAHWAFEPVRRPAIPSVKAEGRVRNPIDAFVLARLESAGITPASRADRRTLIRRLTLDLTGLPPTIAEQDAFLGDTSPDAYERLVDRLLSSPSHGERWARHWLDVVRYAESNGYERDGAKPEAWRYRDYVIDALNADKPYDRFLVEQIAGDELEDASPTTRIATTFLRLGTWDDEPAEPAVDRCDQLDDVLGTAAAAFLGITLRCARCHDHKFEPFTQADYYRFFAIFDPLKRPQVGRIEHPVEIDDDAVLASRASRRITGMALSSIGVGAIGSVSRGQRDGGLTAYIFEESAKPAPTRILKRGDPHYPLEIVEPGVPGVPGVFKNRPEGRPRPTAKTSGRRLWLARWMASAANPLTARVMVNRLWQGHFGRGIVASSDDFGVVGDLPSHPKLLDWLAAELVEKGWSLKAIHRLIVTSETYRMAVDSGESSKASDPDDLLLSRWPRRRLEAEAIRDSVLAVSGRLNAAHGGPSIFPMIPRAVLAGQSRPGEGWPTSAEPSASRRSIYVFVKRSLVPPELELLDTPDTTTSCERRPTSTTGPQALTYLNGAFIQGQSAHFADRLRRDGGDDPEAQVALAFRLVLARAPHSDESKAAIRFLEAQSTLVRSESKGPISPDEARHRALRAFALVMLNLNEFVFLD